MQHRLPYTGLSLDHDLYKVTAYREHTTRDGVSYTATLRFKGKIVGTIENEGFGGETGFWPKTNADNHHQVDLALLALTASYDDGEHPSLAALFEDLVSEYEWPKLIAKAAAKGRIMLRLMDQMFDDDDKPVLGPYPAERAEADAALLDQPEKLRALMTRQGDPGPGRWWQAWTGLLWTDVTDRPAAILANLYH